MRTVHLLLAVLFSVVPALAQSPPEPLGIALEGYAYPFPVRFLPLTVERHVVRLAYMDVAPTGAANGRAVLLMHGRNFPASPFRSQPAAKYVKAVTRTGELVAIGEAVMPNLYHPVVVL